jgi:hypothetical protein
MLPLGFIMACTGGVIAFASGFLYKLVRDSIEKTSDNEQN